MVESLPAYSSVGEMVEELRRAGIETELDWQPPQDSNPALVADWDLMVREGITNILRHAQATRAAVKLSPDGVGWLLMVEDNGRGMNRLKGQGLCGIEGRALRWNGRVSIVTAPNAGTRIFVRGDCGAVTTEGGERSERVNDPDYCR